MSGVPVGWQLSNLEHLAKAMSGGTPSKSEPRYWTNGDIPWVSPKDMKTRSITGAEDSITRDALERLSMIPENSVLVVVRSGILSRTLPVATTMIPVTINQDMRAFHPEAGISHEFLAWQLIANEREILAQCSKDGTTVASIEGNALAQFPIRVAPRAEQTRIVEKLEELLGGLDAAVAELQAAQRKLALYRQSLLKAAVDGTLTAGWRAAKVKPQEPAADLLQHILRERRARWEDKQRAKFAAQGKPPPNGWQAKYPEPVAPDTAGLPELPEGWVWASVEQIASDQPYALAIGPFGSNLIVSDYRGEGVPLVFVRNIRNRLYGGDATKFVSAQKAEELKAHQVSAGDVLVTKMGEPPGDADVYPAGQPDAVITADCIKVRAQDGLMLAEYLAAAINSPMGASQIKPMTQGVAQKKISLGRFSTFAVPLPPLEEQHAILEQLDTALTACDAQQAAIAHGLKQAAAQRRNLLKAAFAGQLVPQDPGDEPASALLARIRAAKADNAGSTRAARNAK
ncbi:MAG: restriction endonuclease subunit S [Xanthomonadaceae bacterium]|nr:restriction endonuclease subunit S [Xanthomonadaceae bacterium]